MLKDYSHGGSRLGGRCHAQIFSDSWLRLSQAESPAQALDDGDTAMRAGAPLQGRLGFHLPTARVKGEEAIDAFSMFVPPTKDVDLSITHGQATVLLSGQTDRQTVITHGQATALLSGQTDRQLSHTASPALLSGQTDSWDAASDSLPGQAT